MTLITVPAQFVPDYQFWNGASASSFVSTLLDAATDKAAAVVEAPKAGTLGKVRLRFGAVPAINGASTIKVSFQGVDPATGNPDGVDVAFRLIAAGSVVANTSVLTGLITSDGTDGGTKLTVTRGQRFAIVVMYGTFTAGDQVNINNQFASGTRQSPNYYTYPVSDLTGTWGKGTNFISLSVEYDDGSYAYWLGSVYPVAVSSTVTYNNTSNPDEIGVQFQWPTPKKIGGAWLGIDADGDFEVVIYNGTAGTVLYTSDKDIRSGTVAQTGLVRFTAEYEIAANTTYVLAIKPTTATSIILSFLDVAVVGEMDQLGAGGQTWMYATAKDPTTKSNFTTTTTRRPMIGLVFTAEDDGASAGGGIRLAGHGGLAA